MAELFEFHGFYVPEQMMEPINKYVQFGTLPNDFWQCIISNDLQGAMKFADVENMHNIPAFMAWLETFAPEQCFGTHAKMNRWKEVGGTHGLKPPPKRYA